ncbi:MAG: DNA repair protein RadC [Patescibacteria group bacterium]|nr:DNA repair protein RadC [Patescibacteria group bacterium]
MPYRLQKNNHPAGHGRAYEIKRVRDMAEGEKPREKMISDGVGALSLAELLAVVLGVGTKREEVFSMASRLLREYGEKAIAAQKDPLAIVKELKLPEAKACQIVACFELGRRLFQKKPGGLITIRNAAQAFAYLKDMGALKKEQFRGLYLNNHYQLIHDEVISIGTIDASLVQAREVFRPALEYGASAIIIAHNHPSGVLKSSREDAEITSNLLAAGNILDIEILDHLIIGDNKYISII